MVAISLAPYALMAIATTSTRSIITCTIHTHWHLGATRQMRNPGLMIPRRSLRRTNRHIWELIRYRGRTLSRVMNRREVHWHPTSIFRRWEATRSGEWRSAESIMRGRAAVVIERRVTDRWRRWGVQWFRGTRWCYGDLRRLLAASTLVKFMRRLVTG